MAFVITGVVQDKKEKTVQAKNEGEEDKVYRSLMIAFLGFILPYQVEKDKFEEFQKGDVVKVKILPSPKSIISDNKKSTINYFEPVIKGIKKGNLKEIINFGTGKIGVLTAQVISLGTDEEGKDKGSYSELSIEGDLMGKLTGSKDLAEGLNENTIYNVIMTCQMKKGVLQVIPTAFEEFGVMEDDGF